MKKVYLLTIVDKAYNEYSDQVVFHSVYQDKGLAKHYMLKDIVERQKWVDEPFEVELYSDYVL